MPRKGAHGGTLRPCKRWNLRQGGTKAASYAARSDRTHGFSRVIWHSFGGASARFCRRCLQNV